MNKRTLLIIAGLALPPVALAIIIQASVPSVKIDTAQPASKPNAAQPVKEGAISSEPRQLPPLTTQASDASRYPTAAAELDQLRQRTADRLKELENMTSDDWPAERERNVHAPATLDEALAHNRGLIAELNAMTPANWAAGERPSHMRGGSFTVPAAAGKTADGSARPAGKQEAN